MNRAQNAEHRHPAVANECVTCGYPNCRSDGHPGWCVRMNTPAVYGTEEPERDEEKAQP